MEQHGRPIHDERTNKSNRIPEILLNLSRLRVLRNTEKSLSERSRVFITRIQHFMENQNCPKKLATRSSNAFVEKRERSRLLGILPPNFVNQSLVQSHEGDGGKQT